MNRAIAIAVIGVIAISLIGASMYATGGSSPTGMTIVLYDDAGNKVYEVKTVPSGFGFGFANKDGATVTKAVVTITYTVTKPTTATGLSVKADLTITTRLNTYTSGVVKVTTDPFTSTKVTDTFTKEYLLSDLISPIDSTGKANGWSVEFSVKITASATIDGATKTASGTYTASLLISWKEEALSIVGSISLS